MPTQAQLGTVSRATSAGIWKIIHDDLDAAYRAATRRPFRDTWVHQLLANWWVESEHQMAHQAPKEYHGWVAILSQHFDEGFPHPYNLAQYFLEHARCPEDWKAGFADVLIRTRAAYRVVDGRIIPFGSDEELQQLKAAMAIAGQSGVSGSRAHLMNAATEMTAGNWAGSVHEAISAVEAAARFKTGEHGKGLSDILKDMKKSGEFKHPALADALGKIYAYSSDAKGIRHSLVLSDQADVSERDAFLMLGLCASMTSYLLAP